MTGPDRLETGERITSGSSFDRGGSLGPWREALAQLDPLLVDVKKADAAVRIGNTRGGEKRGTKGGPDMVSGRIGE